MRRIADLVRQIQVASYRAPQGMQSTASTISHVQYDCKCIAALPALSLIIKLFSNKFKYRWGFIYLINFEVRLNLQVLILPPPLCAWCRAWSTVTAVLFATGIECMRWKSTAWRARSACCRICRTRYKSYYHHFLHLSLCPVCRPESAALTFLHGAGWDGAQHVFLRQCHPGTSVGEQEKHTFYW